ncbi:MAG: tetratricopeptide repeat protein [Candidatus Omnitrophica bacterium]|nr:tetratricopeptide repeat protein [Candidatus Omnitrophota bacterium]
MTRSYSGNDMEKRLRGLLRDDSPDIAPDDRVWDKFSRRLADVSQTPSPDRGNHGLYFAAALALVIGVALYLLVTPARPHVSNAKGTVKIFDSSANRWYFAGEGYPGLGEGDIIKTFDDGECDLVSDGKYYMRLRSGSELLIKELPSKIFRSEIKYVMDKGDVLTYFRKVLPIHDKMSLETGSALVSVVGTDFMVKSAPSMANTWVGVLTGAVRIDGKDIDGRIKKDGGILVNPGEKVVIDKGKNPPEPSRMLGGEIADMSELYGMGNKEQVALIISGGTERVKEMLEMPIVYISDKSSSALIREMGKILGELKEAFVEGRKDKYLSNIASFEAFLDEHPDPKYDVILRLFIGAYYEKIGEHAKSIAVFGDISRKHPDSALLSLADCAIAVIFEGPLADPDKARELYRKILEKYPDSPEAEYARLRLVR